MFRRNGGGLLRVIGKRYQEKFKRRTKDTEHLFQSSLWMKKKIFDGIGSRYFANTYNIHIQYS